jgi:glycosyltransferase involved in cell wall biosynthesis
LNIIQVNSTDNIGGAAKAMYRLHLALQNTGHLSKVLVQEKTTDDPNVLGPRNRITKVVNKVRPHLDLLPLNLYRERQLYPWSLGLLPQSNLFNVPYDIIHLHWVGSGFIPINYFNKFNKPIVWTLHDSWAFTGGCHIPFDCYRYLESCGNCPQLRSGKNMDLSYRIWQKKRRNWKLININLVTPSNWLAECAKKSALFFDQPVEVIPNGLDLSLYKPINKKFAREVLRLPNDYKIILFGAMNSTSDYNKGFHFLQPSLKKLSLCNTEIVIVGSGEPQNRPDFGFPSQYFGRINDDYSMVLLYSAADLVVVPSIQENLPNMIMEALACGTPCVAFKVGGISDLITHKQNGYLAQPFEVEELAYGMQWILDDNERWRKLSDNARETVVQNYDIQKITLTYVDFYKKIINQTLLDIQY